MITPDRAREINVGIARGKFISDVVNGSAHPFHVFTPVGPAYAEALFALNVRKMQVMALLYGTENGEPRSAEQVAFKLGLPQKHVDTLIQRVMRELRQPNVLTRILVANT